MEPINWDDIYIQLYAYTDQLLKLYSWFRKGKSDSYLKGKQVHDYVADAIEKHLGNPEKFDPSTGRSLLTYLKRHIIRTLVGNDARSPENRVSSDLLSEANSENDDDPFQNIEAFLPFIAASFDLSFDCKQILSDIENQLQSDRVAHIIFQNVRLKGFKRREVIKEYNLQPGEFDNGMKRLITVLNKIQNKYNHE
jgi:hypothetical protein